MYQLKENERWIKGYEGRYLCNTDSEIYSVVSGKFHHMKGSLIMDSKRGYSTYKIVLFTAADGVSSHKYIHRLVAETFIPNPENKPQVNHKNGIKTDNSIENLEWVTASENSQHAWDNGSFDKYRLKNISDSQSKEMMLDYLCKNVGRKYTFNLLYELKSHLPDIFSEIGLPKEIINVSLKQKSYLDEWIHILIVFTIVDSNEYSLSEMSKMFGLDFTTISKIKSGTRWESRRRLYEKYKDNPIYVLPHLTKIRTITNRILK